MNEIDLKSLSRLKMPEPDAMARSNAVERAMLAFDEAGEEENSTATQGSADELRPTSTKPTLWSNIMSIFSKPLSPKTMALMTGVCLLPIAGVVTWNVFERNPLGQLPVNSTEKVAGQIARSPADAKRKDATVAGAAKRDDAQVKAIVVAKPEEFTNLRMAVNPGIS